MDTAGGAGIIRVLETMPSRPRLPVRPPRTLLACAAVVLLGACPQPNSTVRLGERTLEPRSSAFWSGPVGAGAKTHVVVADQSGLCDRYEEADACTQAAQAGTPGDGTFLRLTATGQAVGDYAVGGKDARQAEASFLVREQGAIAFEEKAVSGTLTFAQLEPGGSVAGRYALKMASGAVIEGDFGADACGAYDRLVKRIADADLACASSYAPTTCSSKCTCGPRVNSADCTRADSASVWECTCNREGVRTKCSVPKTEANVCTQGNGCCDTSF